MNRTIAGLAISLLQASVVFGATLQVGLFPDAILPATAADITVTISNPGPTTLDVDPKLALWVKPPRGESFFADRLTSSAQMVYRPIPEVFYSPETGKLAIPAEAKLTISIPFSDGVTFFTDPRLSQPGLYRVSGVMKLDDGTELRSGDVRLQIVEPTGLDAEVWKRMRQVCGEDCAWEHWQSVGFHNEVLSQFKDSKYAEYATGYDCAKRSDGAIRREIGMRGPYREHILLYEADEMNSSAFRRAVIANDLSAAIKAMNAKRRDLEALLAETNDVYIIAKAKVALNEIPTPAEISSTLRETDSGGGRINR